MDYYLGEIRLFAGSFAPAGWHLCDGATLNISCLLYTSDAADAPYV